MPKVAAGFLQMIAIVFVRQSKPFQIAWIPVQNVAGTFGALAQLLDFVEYALRTGHFFVQERNTHEYTNNSKLKKCFWFRFGIRMQMFTSLLILTKKKITPINLYTEKYILSVL